MNKKFALGFLSIIALLLTCGFSSISASAAPLLVEDFTYPAGSALSANGWLSHSGTGTNTIVTSEPGLTLGSYPSAGNAVSLTTNGEDVNRAFAGQTSGTVYGAFLVTVSDASVDPAGGYFFHFGPDPVGSTFRGRVFIKKDASNNIAFGISKAVTTAADIVFTPFSYSLNTTYLVVLKYTIVDGAGNDTVSLIVSPNVPSTEPAATITATDTTQSDIVPATVSLRQGATATSPTVRVDGIRVGTTWADVTGGSTPPVNVQHVSDYNGDGKTDFAVVRNTGGGADGAITWFINLNGTATTYASRWGIATDDFIPADFDGDDKSDIAVWRGGAQGVFYILQSSDLTVRIDAFGQTNDDPTVVDDYDGDGKADVAVYREGLNEGEQSVWYYRGSLNNAEGNITYVPWGQAGDYPSPGDYDGDDKADFVIQRDDGNGGARFWMLQTTAGYNSVRFGTFDDQIAPGDYDGDGKTDIAVVRDADGVYQWFYRPSSTGVVSGAPFATFGDANTDVIVQGDYDGDGKTDAAIWRPGATAHFWVLGSTSGVFSVPFGQSGDLPPANFNVR